MRNVLKRSVVLRGLLVFALITGFTLAVTGCAECNKPCVKQVDQSKCAKKCDPAKCKGKCDPAKCSKAKAGQKRKAGGKPPCHGAKKCAPDCTKPCCAKAAKKSPPN